MSGVNSRQGTKYYLRKLRDRGLAWPVTRMPTSIAFSVYVGISRYLRRAIGRVSWVVPQLRFMVRRSRSREKRILAIWDFSKVPVSIGEYLAFQELTLVLRIIHGVEKIDIIWLYGADSFRSDGGLTPDNYHYYLSGLLPLAYVNPHLGSFLLMDSPEMLESYIADNHHRYYIVPPYIDDQKTFIGDYTQYFRYVYTFYHEHGFIPHLSCNPAMVSWARLIINEIVGQQIPIVVHLRNAIFHEERNAKLDCWLEFFEYCQDRFDVKFIIIGEKNELDDRFRSLPNVVFSKDFGTTVEQDMALIQASCFYLGTTSGPGVMAIFSDRPYIIFYVRVGHVKLAHGSQHPFATPLQRLVWQTETTEILINEFEDIFNRIDTAKWQEDFNREVAIDRDKLVWRDRRTGVVFRGWK